MTNQPTILRRWTLNKTTFSEADYLWCKGLKVGLRAPAPEIMSIDTAYGSRRVDMYTEIPRVLITTNTREQEAMLKLKYGDSLILMQEEISPYDIPYGL